MVNSFVSALTLMLAFIFGPPVGCVTLHKRDGLSFGEGRFYCIHYIYRYIRTKLHPFAQASNNSMLTEGICFVTTYCSPASKAFGGYLKSFPLILHIRR